MRDKLRALFPHLKPTDIESTSMGASGEDIKLSSQALTLFPFAVESKFYAQFSVYKHFKQAEIHAAVLSKKNNQTVKPLVVLKQNHSKPLVLLDLDDFLSILKKSVDNDD